MVRLGWLLELRVDLEREYDLVDEAAKSMATSIDPDATVRVVEPHTRNVPFIEPLPI